MAAANNVRLTANTRNLDLRATTGNALLKAGGSMNVEAGSVTGSASAQAGDLALTAENNVNITATKQDLTLTASAGTCTFDVKKDFVVKVNGETKQLFNAKKSDITAGFADTLFLGATEAMFIGQRLQLHVGLNGLINMALAFNIQSAIVLDAILGGKVTAHYGWENKVNTLKTDVTTGAQIGTTALSVVTGGLSNLVYGFTMFN
ncbi:MAG: hypothetical protein HY323_10745 [Betaproteobacteria bacterium]|nr:hypothetical protein [Betaproteobacteria bacterium]